jgi:hypothetical protein
VSHAPVPLLLERLQAVKARAAGHWQARCPAHADLTPSLSVSEGDDGRALVHCHAGCSPEAICAAVSLASRDLFPARPARNKTRGARNVVAEYAYTDEQGQVLFEVVRYHPKRFNQFRPHPQGGRIWGLSAGWYQRRGADWHRVSAGKPLTPDAQQFPECERVLYRLPDLLRAERTAWVFVVEGEKDADRLASLGLTATTNAQGAGCWDETYSERLRGRCVAVIPDNDESGRAHAGQVAGSLSRCAADVRIVLLPGVPEKGDVSDWLDQGGTVPVLLALVEAAPRAAEKAPDAVAGRPENGHPTPARDFTQDVEDVQDNQDRQDSKGKYVTGVNIRALYDAEMAAGTPTSLCLNDYLEVARQVQGELRAAQSGSRRCRSSPEFEALRIVKAHPTVAGLPPAAAQTAVEQAMNGLRLPTGADPWSVVFGIDAEDARTLFFCKWDDALCPAGAKLLDPVFQEAQARSLRFATQFPSSIYQMFLTAVYLMQRKKRGGLVMICGHAFAARLRVSAPTVYSYIAQAVKDGHLKRVSPHVYQPGGGGRCAEFRFQSDPVAMEAAAPNGT